MSKTVANDVDPAFGANECFQMDSGMILEILVSEIRVYLKTDLSKHKMELCLSIFQISRQNLFAGFRFVKIYLFMVPRLWTGRNCLMNHLKSNPVLNMSQSGIFFVQFVTPQYFFKCSTRISGPSGTVEFSFVELTEMSSENIIKIPKVNSLILKWK